MSFYSEELIIYIFMVICITIYIIHIIVVYFYKSSDTQKIIQNTHGKFSDTQTPILSNKPPKYKLIGLSGKIGTGKDTAAKWICESYPEYEIVPFAGALKKVVSIMTSTSYESQFTREGKSYQPPNHLYTISRYHQLIGQFGREYFHNDIWINIALNHPAKYKIISDVRYPNEADTIKAAGGIVIRIVSFSRNYFTETRENGSRKIIDDGRDIQHISETALDNYQFDNIIFNDGTLGDFKEKLFWILA